MYGRGSGQNYLVAVLGGLILLVGLYGWGMEPSAEPEEPHAEGEPDGPEGDREPALTGAGAPAGALEAGSEAAQPAPGAGDGEGG